MSCKHPTFNVKEVTGAAFVAVCEDCGASSGPASTVEAASAGQEERGNDGVTWL